MQTLTLVAILTSPVVAVLISVWLEGRREQRRNKFWVLTNLLAHRGDLPHPESVLALNMIDLAFHKNQKVRELWHQLYDMACNEGLNSPVGAEERVKKANELIAAVAKVLKYGKKFTLQDVERVYRPVGLGHLLSRSEEIQNELLRVLKAAASVEVHPSASEK